MIEQPERSPGFLLWRLTLRWQREVTAALEPFGLTHVQFVLLASTARLKDHDVTPSQAALAAHAGTDVAMTSQVVRALEAKGLLAREVDPRDSRARVVRLTPAGAALAGPAVDAVEAVDRALLAPLPRTVAAGFTAGLRRLAAPD
ncbi:MarR family winged helix-turn-helix transcriptional regulator [Jatrophihabitans sp. YIM 134969]